MTVDRSTRGTYPLSPLLQYEDGSSFAGQGAWSPSNVRHCYYWNRIHNVRIAADVLEQEATRIVEKVISNSKEMADALRRRLADKSGALAGLAIETKAAQGRLRELLEEKTKLPAAI